MTRKVYIVHGYTASADKHWFPWLTQQLHALGIECTALNMPDSQNPTPEAWLAHLQAHAPVNENTIFVGHSLGCIAVLNYLAAQQAQPRGCVFVSGFYQPLDTLPELTPFANFYAEQTACIPQNAYTIAAFDDQIVPHRYTEALAEHLNADYFRLKQGGHFLDRQGCTEFPLVLSIIKQLCNLTDFRV